LISALRPVRSVGPEDAFLGARQRRHGIHSAARRQTE
jgi:hypothetical protein